MLEEQTGHHIWLDPKSQKEQTSIHLFLLCFFFCFLNINPPSSSLSLSRTLSLYYFVFSLSLSQRNGKVKDHDIFMREREREAWGVFFLLHVQKYKAWGKINVLCCYIVFMLQRFKPVAERKRLLYVSASKTCFCCETYL